MTLQFLSSKRILAGAGDTLPPNVPDGTIAYQIVDNTVTKFVKIAGTYLELAAS